MQPNFTYSLRETSHRSKSLSDLTKLQEEINLVPVSANLCSNVQDVRCSISRGRRVFDKNGKENVYLREIPHKRSRYVRDLGNTLLGIRWRWILSSLCVANAVAWITFALIWMGVATAKGDRNKPEAEWCVVGTRHFTGYLLLSIETLTTIGFGQIYPGNCREAWVVLTLQALTGVAIEGALVTAVYVKMARPFTKHSGGLFSRKAVVLLRDGKFCLIFRIFDPIGKHMTMTKIKAFFIQRKLTDEGERMDNYMVKLKLEKWGLIMWPVDVVHVIDEESPLWKYSARDLLTTRFEILAVLYGESSVTGQPSQSQTSYINSRILWGRRFVGCTEFDDAVGKYIIDVDKFNATIPFDTPLCSPSSYSQIMEEHRIHLH